MDVSRATWWTVDVHGPAIRPRVSTAIVGIGHKLFIFGGCSGEFWNSGITETYCIATYCEGIGWSWEARDVPYPKEVPPLGCAMDAIPIFGGQKILITPGCRALGENYEEEVRILKTSEHNCS